MSRAFTKDEVSVHNSANDLLLIIDGNVYDATRFQHEHPGGDEFLLDQGGTDVTELFEDAGHSDEARNILKTLFLGKLVSQEHSQSPKMFEQPTRANVDRSYYFVFLIAVAGIILYFL